jgi:hypothetical protein
MVSPQAVVKVGSLWRVFMPQPTDVPGMNRNWHLKMPSLVRWSGAVGMKTRDHSCGFLLKNLSSFQNRIPMAVYGAE